jgi:hypothetical protein
MEYNCPAHNGLQTQQRLEQSGFAGTVRAEDGGEAAARNRQRNAGENRLTIVTDGQAFERNDGVHIIFDRDALPRVPNLG